MKRFLGILFIALALTCILMVVWQQKAVSALANRLDMLTREIADEYHSVIEPSRSALSRQPLLPVQRERLERLPSLSAAMREARHTQARVDAINDVQLALSAFLGSVSSDDPLRTHPSFGPLARMMDERGDMRDTLDQYNQTAVQWNNAADSALASLTMGSESGNLLPYLRFDGQKDYAPVIDI